MGKSLSVLEWVSPFTRGRGSKLIRTIGMTLFIGRPSHGAAHRNDTDTTTRPGSAPRQSALFASAVAPSTKPSIEKVSVTVWRVWRR